MIRRQSTTIDVRGKSKMSFSGKGIEMQELSPFSDRIKDTSRKRMLSEKSYDGGKSYDAKVMRMTPSMMNDDNSNASHASHASHASIASSHMTMNTMHSMDLEKRSVRQNHSEIEKRRRNKMNNYINELSLLIPTCVAMSRKMDKLTVLRLAVQHIKSLKGSIHAYSEISPRPSNLSDSDLMSLVLKSAADEACFLFVVDSGRGRILYVSESVSKILNYSQRDLFGQCLFDVLHPKDISKVKEQMSSRNHTPQPRDRHDSDRRKGSSKHFNATSPTGTEPISAAATTLPWLSPGARRSFFCRIREKPGSVFKEEPEQDPYLKRKRANGDKKYCTIQCTGYLKVWSSTASSLVKMDNEGVQSEDENTNDSYTDSKTGLDNAHGAMDCLVAVGRLQSSLDKPIEDAVSKGLEVVPGIEFGARHTMDGMFTFIDPKMTTILGYLPQELIGSSVYEHVLYDDIPGLVEGHKKALKVKEEVKVAPVKFRCKDGRFVGLLSTWKQFQNPWSKEVDFIVAKYFLCNPESAESKIQPLIMGQSTFSVNNDLNFFTCDNAVTANLNDNISGAASCSSRPSRPSSSIGRNIQDVVSGHLEGSRIGKLIVEEMKNSSAKSITGEITEDSSNHSASPLSALLSQNTAYLNSVVNNSTGYEVSEDGRSLTDSIDTLTTNPYIKKQQPSPRSFGGPRSNGGGPPGGYGGASPLSVSEDNDEATMAVIMSLLEADGGLGGPMDTSTIPWPMP